MQRIHEPQDKSYLYLKTIDENIKCTVRLWDFMYYNDLVQYGNATRMGIRVKSYKPLAIYEFSSDSITFPTGEIYKYDEYANFNKFIKGEIDSEWYLGLTANRLEKEMFFNIPKLVPLGSKIGNMASSFDFNRKKIVSYIAISEIK